MRKTAEDIEREEIEKLLPWYATGTLTRTDAEKVERYLAIHPQMTNQLDLILTEREQAVLANEALALPSDGAFDRLIVTIPGARRVLWRAPGHWITGLLSTPRARGVRWAALAAAAFIVAQAAAITGLLVRERAGTYQAASGQAVAGGVFALVAFADDAKAQAMAQLLAEFDATIVDGPKPGGVYKIRLRTADGSQRSGDALLRRLAERRDVVRIVLPSSN